MADFIIEAQNLGKVYRTGKVTVEALRGVNLAVKAANSFLSWGPPVPASRLFSISSVDSRRPLRVTFAWSPSTSPDWRRRTHRTSRQDRELRLSEIQSTAQPHGQQNIDLARYFGGNQGADGRPVQDILEKLGIANRLSHCRANSRAENSSGSPSPARW